MQFELFDAAIAPLLDYRRELSAELSAEEVRKKMRAKAEEVRSELPEIPMEVGGQQLPPDWLLDYVETRVGSTTDFEVADIFGGYFYFQTLQFEGGELPVMQVIMSPFTPRKEFLAKVDYAFRRQYEPMVKMRPDSLREGVRCFTYWTQGVKDKDIADIFLTEEGAFEKIEADSDAEREQLYKVLLRRRTAKVRQFRKRFGECVTEVTSLESRE